MKKLVREPLVHFIALGILIFVIYGFIGEKESSENTIVFDTYDLDNILSTWELQWKRPPTGDELSNLIKQNIKQEIFYKEALVMNLDHNDEIIKRRLSQKMQFLSNDLARMKSPSDDELEVYYKENESKYLLPYQYTFYQIVFNPDKRDNPIADAEKVLSDNPNASFEQMQNKGDKLPFKYKYDGTYDTEISAVFGQQFSENLAKIPTGKWIGPVGSGFGYHLVFIEKRADPSAPDLKAIADKVLNDYTYEQQETMDELIYSELKKKYTIEFELDDELVDPEIKNVVTNTFN